ncbi:hypothetical protein Zmor_013173 [Zophobas morio]|uniref:CLIP domain-containing serine protease n=1 Tax=Zophobas morio TaxID=2755281 RepID=A0AA38IA81_9CUCU|nr:hypothetical protein Zmor_013173 [Zophobas morio]
MFTKFIIVCVVLCQLKYTVGQSSVGTSCTTPAQTPGTCVTINDCPVLLNLLLTQSNNKTVRNYLRSSVCENNGRNPVVCCPLQRSGIQNDNNAPSNPGSVRLPRSPNCGFSNTTTPRIINGVPAKLGEFPWIVALGYRNAKNPDLPRWLCGGSLITSRHILTAGHCVYNQSNLYLARIGDLDLFSDDDGASPSTIPLTKDRKVHEDFNPSKYSNDIAILTLEREVNNRKFVFGNIEEY